MKKALALLLCGLLLLGLFCGCGTKPADTPTQAPTDPPLPQREPGTNQLVFYWNNGGKKDLSKCDMWIWYPNAEGRGYLFEACSYGGRVVVNVPEDVEQVGFIVRTDCSDPGGSSWGDANKDFGEDRFARITGETTVIYLKSGDGSQYFSKDGGETLSQEMTFDLAAIVDLNQIKYFISPAVKFTSLDQVKVMEGDRELEIAELSSLNNEVVTGVITLKEELDITKSYTVLLEGFAPKPAVPTDIFASDAFNEKYYYDGDDLGAVIQGDATAFKVWAPTAAAVVLNLYRAGDGGSAYEQIEMTRQDKGVWYASAPCGHGTYYTYSVTTALGTQEAVDPYARSLGVNGDRGMVVDLALTDPAGFAEDRYYSGIGAYNEAVIWEVHMRDFSNTIQGSKYPGKYLAFTETGLRNSAGNSVGVDYLKDLGVTHVHFQPLYDYATVDESKDTPQFNWGYDPKNYNAPEGSYATDPYHGEVRVTEFKQMVQALHQNGMGVVMDVVYNHTYSLDSCLNRIVPYYYYRYNAKGSPSNGSGCGNETASERLMFRKYMVDSVRYWAKEYHVDGFRFDLMALHDVETMQQIEAAVHAVNPNAILYGEGWTGGDSPLRENLRANQKNIGKITANGIGAVAVFNDAIRDGLKGSVFDAKDRAYINGRPDPSNAGKVIFGLMGGSDGASASEGSGIGTSIGASASVGWSVENNMVINYMSCHDNNTLWDKLEISNPDASEEERFLMNRLGISIVMIGRGIPLFLAGEEMLRTKQGDENSYASSDEINNLDWEVLQPGSLQLRMRDFYRGLISMRKANDFLTKAEVRCETLADLVIAVRYSVDGVLVASAYINPGEEAVTCALPAGSWGVLLDGEQVSDVPMQTVSGTAEVAGKGVLLVAAP